MLRKIEKLAYVYEEGDSALPAVVFLPGFRSDMKGVKAQYLLQQCRARGQTCLLLDYSGHGASDGKFEEGSIGQWTRDALQVIDAVIKQDLIVIGSSMGGWIALHVALVRPQLVKGLIGIAAAPDFTRSIQRRFSEEQKKDLDEKGFFAVPSEYGEDLIITANLIKDGEAQCLLDRPVPLHIPVTLIQGKCDADVSWQMAEKIQAALTETTTEIVYIEDGDHRLSRPEDLALIDAAVLTMARNRSSSGG